MILKIFAPLIFFFGLFGNAINIYVFTRPSLLNLSTFRFLVYLSFIDFLYVLIGTPHIISIVYSDYDFRNYSNLLCSIHSFLTIYLSHLSSNILAVVGVYRCVTINSLKPVVYKPIVKRSSKKLKNNQNNSSIVKNNNNNNNQVGTGGSIKQQQSIHQIDSVKKKSPKLMKHDKVQIIRSSNKSRLSKKIFILNFFSKSGSADLLTLLTCLVLFLFDFHYLIWMRLSYEINEQELLNQTFNMDYNNEFPSSFLLTTITTSNLHKYNTSLKSLSSKSIHKNSIDQSNLAAIIVPLSMKCYPPREIPYYEFYTKIWPWIDLFLYSYIPFVIMLACTILIIYRIFSINKNLKNHKNASLDKLNTINNNNCSNQSFKHTDKVKILNNGKLENSNDDDLNSHVKEPYITLPSPSANGLTALSLNETAANFISTTKNTVIQTTRLSVPFLSTSTKNKNESHSNNIQQSKYKNNRRNKKNNQVYKLLLTLNICFFVLVAPLVTSNTLGLLADNNQIITELFYTLSYLNHCLNFIFYFFSCKIYRQIIMDKFYQLYYLLPKIRNE